MRMRALIAVVTVGAAGFGMVPSGAGQHFGVIIGDLLTFGLTSASAASSRAVAMPGGAIALDPLPSPTIQASGFFFGGVSAASDSPSSGLPPTLAIATVGACVTVQTNAGSDFGCVDRIDIPTFADPLLMKAAVWMEIPSQVFSGGFISVNLSFRGAGMIEPKPAMDVSQETPPEFQVSLGAALTRPATVNGSVSSSGLQQGGDLSADTPGTMSRGASITACSLNGRICP